jgi:RecG-like helicase
MADETFKIYLPRMVHGDWPIGHKLIADCVMAGMARSGSVYPLELPTDVLVRAFQNTVELLKSKVVVE